MTLDTIFGVVMAHAKHKLRDYIIQIIYIKILNNMVEFSLSFSIGIFGHLVVLHCIIRLPLRIGCRFTHANYHG